MHENGGGIGRAMLSGFNTNFRHRGVLFHVQTEDSGLDNPHVITHLFHGGNILASEKRDYSDLLGQENIEEPVRKLMESQHKAMLKQLSRGEHDAVLSERLGPELFGVEAPQAEPTSETEELAPASDSPIPSVVAEPAAGGAGAADDESILEPEYASAPASEEPGSAPATPPSRVFGEHPATEKPLDEVVLDYLVENVRKRKRPPK
ncbi:MAG: hypothetical protein JRJ58_11840 [Deltaproteobacteria bacterium]|nr:hypothetical protein [Deltaproteobacteria bacterium]